MMRWVDIEIMREMIFFLYIKKVGYILIKKYKNFIILIIPSNAMVT